MNFTKIESGDRIEGLPHGVWREFAEAHSIDAILGLAGKLHGSVFYIASNFNP